MTLNSQVLIRSEGHILAPFALYDQPIARYKVVETTLVENLSTSMHELWHGVNLSVLYFHKSRLQF